MEGAPVRFAKINLEVSKKTQILWVAFILFMICVIVAVTISPYIIGGYSLV